MATAPPLRTPGAAAEPPGLRGGRGVPAPPEPPGHLERGATGGGEAAAPAPEPASDRDRRRAGGGRPRSCCGLQWELRGISGGSADVARPVPGRGTPTVTPDVSGPVPCAGDTHGDTTAPSSLCFLPLFLPACLLLSHIFIPSLKFLSLLHFKTLFCIHEIVTVV
ncbi:collagen alpha-1(I) chain-like isoform X1 [Myiozetetes cayanensis]|uniref:collagen alpha-1(I) chain-like isoform X1 n=1 Tax=Myiozetetes cayanensis TaxID=478635 RepID=UPI00215FF704|nr:collagen alpha-1(I) chain-like isoform X1 [Myiozetetes cayanensis]